MSNNEEEQKSVEQIFAYISQQKLSGKFDFEIKRSLIEQGIEEEVADQFIKTANSTNAENLQEDDDSGVGGWVIWIGIILGINFLSYLFDWPFWIY